MCTMKLYFEASAYTVDVADTINYKHQLGSRINFPLYQHEETLNRITEKVMNK